MYWNRKVELLYDPMLLKVRITWKKAWNESCSELDFVHKRMYLSPLGVELVGSKDQYVSDLIMYRNKNLGSLYGSTLLKIRITWKKAWNKSYSELNFVQKSPRAHMSISPPPWSGARASKDQYVWNLIMYRNGNLGWLYGSTLPKIHITWKKA